jgi:hypothetical protein
MAERMVLRQRDSGTASEHGDAGYPPGLHDPVEGRPRVFRNEDTGFLWPPYFKFDSEDLQAEAANLTSTEASPQWVSVTHYGWRSNLLSIYPNAVTIRPVAGPDVSLFPWLNIVILFGIVLILFFAWRIWERFEDRVIDPFVDADRRALGQDEGLGRRTAVARRKTRVFRLEMPAFPVRFPAGKRRRHSP